MYILPSVVWQLHLESTAQSRLAGKGLGKAGSSSLTDASPVTSNIHICSKYKRKKLQGSVMLPLYILYASRTRGPPGRMWRHGARDGSRLRAMDPIGSKTLGGLLPVAAL